MLTWYHKIASDVTTGIFIRNLQTAVLSFQPFKIPSEPSCMTGENYSTWQMCWLTDVGWHMHASINIFTVPDNGLSTGWCQTSIWTNAGKLLIGPLGKIRLKYNNVHSRKCARKCRLQYGGYIAYVSIWRLPTHPKSSEMLTVISLTATTVFR